MRHTEDRDVLVPLTPQNDGTYGALRTPTRRTHADFFFF